jgi:hypothetical protein
MSIETEITSTTSELYFDLTPEGPITTISSEIAVSILCLTNQCENTKQVSREWKNLTFTATINLKKHELKQAISLLTEQLYPGIQCIEDLAELQTAHQFLSGYVITFGEIQRLFLIAKGLSIGFLRKLPEEEKNQLQTLTPQLPNSMKDIFDLTTDENTNLETYFTLLQSRLCLSLHDQGKAVFSAIQKYGINFCKLQMATDPMLEEDRGSAVVEAIESNDQELALVLLATGPISEEALGSAAMTAAQNDNAEIIEALLATGLISEQARGSTVMMAAQNDNIEIVKIVLAKGPLSEGARDVALMTAIQNGTIEIVKLLLANGPISENIRSKAVKKANKHNNQELLELLKKI